MYWQLGQALLPEHFYAQEESLRLEMYQRFELAPRPCWGVGRFEWDAFRLTKGTVNILDLSAVFESGDWIDIPGNADEVSFDLNAMGRPEVKLYLQLCSDFEDVELVPGRSGDESIKRVLQKVELSATPSTLQPGLLLAEAIRDASGEWSFSEDYVPPVFRVAPRMLCDGILERIRKLVDQLRHGLQEELLDNYLSGDTQVLVKQVLRSLFALKALLSDLHHQVPQHPYDLFCALRVLYIDACVLRGVQTMDGLEVAYDHKDLAKSFGGLLKPLEDMAARRHPSVPWVAFERQAGLQVCVVSPEVRRAKHIHLLVRKPHVTAQLDLSRIKFASPSRISAVHERALTGVPVLKVERPPFAQTLASLVEVYGLGKGQEWDYAISEGKLAVFDVPALAGYELFLDVRPG